MHWWGGEGRASREGSEAGDGWTVLHMVNHFRSTFLSWLEDRTLIVDASFFFWVQHDACPNIGESTVTRASGGSLREWYSPQVPS
jgi:hypothetical protein